MGRMKYWHWYLHIFYETASIIDALILATAFILFMLIPWCHKPKVSHLRTILALI